MAVGYITKGSGAGMRKIGVTGVLLIVSLVMLSFVWRELTDYTSKPQTVAAAVAVGSEATWPTDAYVNSCATAVKYDLTVGIACDADGDYNTGGSATATYPVADTGMAKQLAKVLPIILVLGLMIGLFGMVGMNGFGSGKASDALIGIAIAIAIGVVMLTVMDDFINDAETLFKTTTSFMGVGTVLAVLEVLYVAGLLVTVVMTFYKMMSGRGMGIRTRLRGI